jgi:hypothetical protein
MFLCSALVMPPPINSQRFVEGLVHRFLAGALLICPLIARVSGAQVDLAAIPGQVVLDARFLELTSEFRKFPRWEDISGDDPAVVEHDAKSISYGAGLNFGQRLGDRPIWLTLGGFYGTGLETNTTLANGDRVHGAIDNIGVGAGLRVVPYESQRFGLFLWAMGFYEWNNGEFETFDGGSTVSEKRIHKTWTGDYGVGAVYLVGETLGLDFGLGYNGQFNKENADEAFRVYLGLFINGLF